MTRVRTNTERWAARLAVALAASVALHAGPFVVVRRLGRANPLALDLRVQTVEIGLEDAVDGTRNATPPPTNSPPDLSSLRPATPPANTAPPSPERAVNCAPMQPRPNAGAAVPDRTTTGQRAEPLGDKLARSDGVLCPPPGVDPEMHAPAPDTGKTPVIPPPGSPGGDPTIRPK